MKLLLLFLILISNCAYAVNGSATNQISAGMITCPAYRNTEAIMGRQYTGCDGSPEWGQHYLTIQDYFNKYKPSNANKITMVIFDSVSEAFDIYYN